MNYSKYEKEKAAVGNTLNCFAFWIAFYWSEHYYSGQWYYSVQEDHFKGIFIIKVEYGFF